MAKKLTQNCIFDWLEFTIFYDHEYDLDRIYIESRLNSILHKIFNISLSNFTYEERGRNGYSFLYNYRNINIWTSFRSYMGIHFEISGQGCRDLEDLGYNLYDILENINNYYTVKYSRIDLSIDDFTNDFYTLEKVSNYLSQRLISCKLKSFYHTSSGFIHHNNKLLGHTIQFGSKGSDLHITFYDKLKEREYNNYIVNDDIKYWTRTELRFRNDKARQVVDKILKTRNLNMIIKGVLKDKIRFLYKPCGSKETNYNRLDTAKWWLKFLDNIDTIELGTTIRYSSLERKRQWLDETCSKTQFMVYISNLDTSNIDPILSEYLFNFLKTGSNKIKFRDLQLINDSRIKNNLLPITLNDVYDIIRGLEDKILENKGL